MYMCIEGGAGVYMYLRWCWCIYVLKVVLVYMCIEGGTSVYMY